MALRRTIAITTLAALLLPAGANAMGDPGVAALQVALRAKGVYGGTIDGVSAKRTQAAVIAFQVRAGLVADGVAGPQTRRALGRRGKPALGHRDIGYGAIGWDVAALQFLLAWHGFPSGPMDGRFGVRLDRALRGFQVWSGVLADGVAGGRTIAALHRPLARSPLRLGWPVAGPIGDGFGPRGTRFHAGLDMPVAGGTPVAAARGGTVVSAGAAGAFGHLVIIAHARGVETYYAHLSRIDVTYGQRVKRGQQIGLVGATGHATGPHLHFEVRLRGAALDPLGALR
jgi:murein DD-endopeptidase MepM/ murein hydrolase activator NlpD